MMTIETTLSCRYCGLGLSPSSSGPNPSFCSQRCRKRSWRRRRSTKPRAIKCPTCGRARIVDFRPGPSPTYCSDRCSAVPRQRRYYSLESATETAMPSRHRRRCTGSPTCPNPAELGGKCREHAAEVEARRGTSRDRGYGRQWAKRRRRFLLEHPYCSRPGCGSPATVADHVEPRRALVARGVTDPDADRRLVPLCASCHSEATVLFDGGLGRPRDLAGKLRWLGLDKRSVG